MKLIIYRFVSLIQISSIFHKIHETAVEAKLGDVNKTKSSEVLEKNCRDRDRTNEM